MAAPDLTPAGALVDLHCHILPGVDDGAADLTDTIAMARQAEADGIGIICATPHIRADHAVEIHELPERVAAVNVALEEAGVAVVVVPGGELSAPRAAELDDDELRAVTLGGGGRWLLVEPQAGPMDDALDLAVDTLHARGMRCVIAHPERHAGADAAERLAGLVARGALVQVTAAFLLGGHGAAPVMLDWAQRGLVHLVASDAHSSRFGRPVAVAEGLAEVTAVPRVAPHAGWVVHDAPRAILAGEDFEPPY